MTLDESKASVLSGAAWGEVYPSLACDDDRAALREWFTRTPGVPTPSAVAARTTMARTATPAPAEAAATGRPVLDAAAARYMGYTGDACARCQSLQLVWAGPCKKCLSCGEMSGGCS